MARRIPARGQPGAKLGPTFEAASKRDTSPAHAIVAPCRLRCPGMVPRLHAGSTLENLNKTRRLTMKRNPGPCNASLEAGSHRDGADFGRLRRTTELQLSQPPSGPKIH